MLKKTALAIAATAMLVTTGVAVEAKTLKVQASSKAGDWAHRFMTDKWAPKLKTMTSGKIGIDVLPTKSVVPHRETIDAVANGILDGDLNAVSYFSGRDPAFAIIGDLIAGYDTVDQVRTFCQYGGGKEILQKLYDKYTKGRVHVVGCGPYAKEAFVSTVPIRGVADFKGVKVRSPEGLAAEVFKRVGAAPVSLPFSEVYTALETKVIDAAEASAPSTTTPTACTKSPNTRFTRGFTRWRCCSSSSIRKSGTSLGSKVSAPLRCGTRRPTTRCAVKPIWRTKKSPTRNAKAARSR